MEWIKANPDDKSTMPEMADEDQTIPVLAYSQPYGMFIGYYDYGYPGYYKACWRTLYDDYSMDDTTHWMPLPEEPRE